MSPGPGTSTDADGGKGPALDPPYDYPPYRSTHLRAPKRPLVVIPDRLRERWRPVFGPSQVRPEDADLTLGHAGEPIGERIIVTGRVTDLGGRPLAGQLVEIWQANAAGRYNHNGDRHPAPLDPNFTGAGRCLTDADGRYRFVSVKPGAYPWLNHDNAWRPAHIHFSLFGAGLSERLVTQMYFPGDPLLELDPIFHSVRDRQAAQSLVSHFDLGTTVEGWALGYRWDVVLGGSSSTPMEA